MSGYGRIGVHRVNLLFMMNSKKAHVPSHNILQAFIAVAKVAFSPKSSFRHVDLRGLEPLGCLGL